MQNNSDNLKKTTDKMWKSHQNELAKITKEVDVMSDYKASISEKIKNLVTKGDLDNIKKLLLLIEHQKTNNEFIDEKAWKDKFNNVQINVCFKRQNKL